MEEKTECMCIQCGIAHHLLLHEMSMEEDPYDPQRKLLTSAYCTECGGVLAIAGRAGDESDYRLK